MGKTFKKILCTLLVVVMCLISVPLSGFVGLVFKAEATEYKVGDIVQFGSYPQSKVVDENIIDSLNALAPEWDEWISYGYYSGDNNGNPIQGDWMRYTDVNFSGKKYRGVRFISYRPRSVNFISAYSNSYQDDNNYLTNETYWFSYDAVDWRILDPIEGLLLCEFIIDAQPYNNMVYSDSGENFSDILFTNYASDYETSYIRDWLNNDFYNTAFEGENQKIITTNLNNDSYSTLTGISGGEKYNGNETEDKVFLLSYNDVINSRYGFNTLDRYEDNLRITHGSDYAKCQGLGAYIKGGLYTDYTNPNGNSGWRLRTPSSSSYNCVVYHRGSASSASDVLITDCGIRPAIYIDIEAYKGVFLEGYNESLDKYSFHNQTTYISVEDYEKLFKPGKAEDLQKESNGTKGQCYGMAATTAMFLEGLPPINTVTTFFNNCNYETNKCELITNKANSISEMDNGVLEIISNCKDSFVEYFNINLSEFISKAYITQYKPSVIKDNESHIDDYQGIIEAVENYINGGEAIIIGVRGDIGAEKDCGHSILPVGIKKTDTLYTVYVNDSNLENAIQELHFYVDNETITGWSYQVKGMDWGSDKSNGKIYFCYPIWDVFLFCSTEQDSKQRQVENDDESYNLLTVSNNSCDIGKKEHFLEIMNSNGNVGDRNLYWVDKEVGSISICDIIEETTFALSDDYTRISAILPIGSNAECVVDDEKPSSLCIDNIKGKGIEFSVFTFDNNNKKTVTVKGKAQGDTITATQTETGLIVTGVSDGTITLTKNDEVIATQNVTDAESDIEITYDKNGESDSLEVEYEAHEHAYSSVVTKEATCTETGVKTFTCECNDQYTETISANGHTDSKWITDKASTCSAEGSKHIECTVCEEVLKTEPIAKLPHNYSSVVTEATCETGGFTTYTCTCGDTYTGDKTPATGHNYSEGVCTTCGDSKIDNCSCNCHKGGISGFFFKIILVFQKIFKTNKICSCGVYHY